MSGIPAQQGQGLPLISSNQSESTKNTKNSQPIVSKLPLSNLNNSQKLSLDNMNPIHTNLVQSINNNSKLITRANTNEGLVQPATGHKTSNPEIVNSDANANTDTNSEKSNVQNSNAQQGNKANSSNESSNNKSDVTPSANNNGYFAGYLLKWTNYIKGYQKRWFVLNNGLLSYFRSQAEMAHTCRGTINLCNAVIQSEDTLHFVVTNGNQQTFHLKASNELEKQKWVSVLEIAKNKSKQLGSNVSTGNIQIGTGAFQSNNQQDSDEDDNTLEGEKTELSNMLKMLQQKLDDLSTSHEFVLKHSSALTKSLSELENIQSKPDEMTIKTINERSTVYKITMLAVVNACQEFINLSRIQTRKMHKVLQSEQEMRTRLEDMVQEMATKQLNFETQLNKRSKRNTQGKEKKLKGLKKILSHSSLFKRASLAVQDNTSQNNLTPKTNLNVDVNDSKANVTHSETANGENSNEKNSGNSDDEMNDDEQFQDEFHDAVEDVCQFSVTLPRQNNNGMMHHRNPSNISKLYLKESDSSEDEQDQYIKVTMHSQKDQKEGPTTITVEEKKQEVVKKVSSNDLDSLKLTARPTKTRRTEILPRPNASVNLWGIMKNCIGKDLSKIPLPVNFSEPLSMLQRVTEELEYSELLDAAAQCTDQWEQMAYIAAFTVSSYSTTSNRTNKPFNPLLGETYECDRLDDFGWRALSEQVSHHPPGFATHVESLKDWTFFQEFTMSSKFRGQYLQIIPLGTSHLEFKQSGNHYTWRKVATFVRNVIVGKLWIDNVGEMDIVNHKTKDICHLKYFAYSYFSREPPRKVTGIITDKNNVARYVLNGTWTDQIEGAPVLNPQVVTESTQLNTGKSKVLWRRRIPPSHLETMYNFTSLAVQLNEQEPGVAPTDSRLRPDQRCMEENKWDRANEEKLRLEEQQRANRLKKREMIQATASDTDSTQTEEEHVPIWFKKTVDPYTNQPIFICNNEYWDCKEKNNWEKCPSLY